MGDFVLPFEASIAAILELRLARFGVERCGPRPGEALHVRHGCGPHRLLLRAACHRWNTGRGPGHHPSCGDRLGVDLRSYLPDRASVLLDQRTLSGWPALRNPSCGLKT